MSNPDRKRILVVDDEKSMCDYLSIILEKEGYETLTASNGKEALLLLEQSPPDLIIQDIKMPGMDGIELLRKTKSISKNLPVVIMTAYSTWETAVEAMRLGASDFIRKPFENQTIKDIVARLIEFNSRQKEDRDNIVFHLAQIIGNSPAMDSVFSEIQTAAGTEATVLITGENGAGKELVARALHWGSSR